jgi:hypothetical protein
MKESTHSTPSTFKFDNLEDQTSHALHILRAVQQMCEGNHTFDFTGEDLEAMSALLDQAMLLLEPLDLRGVAGALHIEKFAMVQDKGAKRPTIACARCSGEARQK